MNLTVENQKHIDSLAYVELLRHNRFAPAGDPWFQGETGLYWLSRMAELRAQPGGDERHTMASTSIGWDGWGR